MDLWLPWISYWHKAYALENQAIVTLQDLPSTTGFHCCPRVPRGCPQVPVSISFRSPHSPRASLDCLQLPALYTFQNPHSPRVPYSTTRFLYLESMQGFLLPLCGLSWISRKDIPAGYCYHAGLWLFGWYNRFCFYAETPSIYHLFMPGRDASYDTSILRPGGIPASIWFLTVNCTGKIGFMCQNHHRVPGDILTMLIKNVFLPRAYWGSEERRGGVLLGVFFSSFVFRVP